ncbi:MAG: peptidase S41, partial [Archangium sp.]
GDVQLREKPLETVKYLKEEKKKEDKKTAKGGKNVLTDSEGTPHDEELDDQLDAESQDEVKEDFEVTFARDYLLAAPQVRRDDQLKGGKGFVVEKRQIEEKRIADAITALGVDWTPGETPKNPQLTSSLKPGSDKKITAGETVPLELTVENKGGEAVKRLRGWIESDNGYLDRREFLFGQVKPGEKKTWTVNVKIPKDLASRRDGVTVKLQDDSGNVIGESAAGELTIVEIARPQFAFTWSIVDDCSQCNGDGLVQRGENVGVILDVTNVGTGKAMDVFSSVRNASDLNIFIEKGRFKLGEIAPGETRSSRFQLEVKKGFKDDKFHIRYAVIDEPLQEFTADKLEIPVATDGAGATFEPSKAVSRLADKADIYADGTGKRVLARLPKGAVVTELARSGGMARIEWEKDRFVFAKISDLREAKGQKAAVAKDATWNHFRTPASISMNVDPSQGGAVIDGEKFSLSSVVTDPQMLDVFVLVNDQKVFFKSATPEDGGKVKFTTDFSLKEGNNLVTIVARESQDFATRKSVVIRRRSPTVAQKEGAAPKQ